MQRIPLISAVLFSLLSIVLSPLTFSQTSSRAAALKPASLDLPTGEAAWAVRVVRSGGLTGGPGNDITLTSEGRLICDPPAANCKSSVDSATLEPLTQLVSSAQIPGNESVLRDSCHDCYVTVITVRRREGGGKDRTYFAYWDDSTAASAPADLVKIARAGLALSSR